MHALKDFAYCRQFTTMHWCHVSFGNYRLIVGTCWQSMYFIAPGHITTYKYWLNKHEGRIYLQVCPIMMSGYVHSRIIYTFRRVVQCEYNVTTEL